MSSKGKITLLVIDQILNDTVIVELHGKALTLPASCFPANSKEGSVVSMELTIDEAETKKRLTNVHALKQELLNRTKQV